MLLSSVSGGFNRVIIIKITGRWSVVVDDGHHEKNTSDWSVNHLLKVSFTSGRWSVNREDMLITIALQSVTDNAIKYLNMLNKTVYYCDVEIYTTRGDLIEWI